MAGSKGDLALDSTVVDLASPAALSKFATTLKKFIVDNDLYTAIASKNYVNVEGWQFAGASMGIFPIVRWTKRIDGAEKEIKYKARVELVRLSDGLVVGAGEAICSSLEPKRSSNDEYVIESMAQTRATGKAFRNCISWIMKLAGYEGTPSEEATTPEAERQVEQTEVPIADVKLLVGTKLASKPASDKVAFLKEHAGTISDTKLTEQQYRRLYAVLTKEAAS